MVMNLQVTIMDAMNLPEDRMGRYELFVKVKSGIHDEKTRKKDVSARSCMWGETLNLRCEEGHNLKFEVKDDEMFGSDTVAEGELPGELFSMRDYSGEVRLNHHGRPAGMLRVRINNPYAPPAMGGMGGMGMGGMGMGGMHPGMGGMHPGMGGMGMGGMHPGMGMGGMRPGMGMHPGMRPPYY